MAAFILAYAQNIPLAIVQNTVENRGTNST